MITELPRPEPGPGEVMIKVQAAAMNPMDPRMANGATRDDPAAAFPIVLGADVAGEVEELGAGATRFSPGDEVFGQLMIGSAGTYAEDVAVAEDAPLAPLPEGLDVKVAAALPTAGGTGLDVVESLDPLDGKSVLIVGAGGGVGSFATQFAANAGADVIANTHASAADRMSSYGAAEVVDRSVVPIAEAVREAHPNGIDVLIDLASDADAFVRLAMLVRPGGTALTTRGVADSDTLAGTGIRGVNYRLNMSSELLRRIADEVVAGRILPPPIADIHLDEVPGALAHPDHADGKTVITM